VPNPAPIGPDGQPVPPPPAFGPDGQPLAPVGVPFAQLPGSGAGSSMPPYVPGATNGPPPAAPSGVGSIRFRRRSSAGVSVLIALGVLARFGGWYLIDELEHRDDDRTSAAATQSQTLQTVPAPAAWDTRIQPLAEFVESERGGAFDHPVTVEFLADADFVAELQSDPDGSDLVRRADGADVDGPTDDSTVFSAEMRALGLLPGGVDFGAAVDDAISDSVVGLYLPDTKRLLVRGDELNPFVASVVVHELTHAWQDQQFGLDQPEPDSSEAQAGLTALIEGDARRVENAYVDQMSDDEYAAYSAEIQQFTDAHGDADPADRHGAVVPAPGRPNVFAATGPSDELDAIQALLEAPYSYGPGFIDDLLAEGGNGAVDDAFADPPTSTEQILFPERYTAADTPKAVDPPKAADGQDVVDRDTMGAYSLLLVLGNRLGFDQAWDAVRGWGGDAMIATRQGDQVCVHIRAVGDTEADTTELAVAFEAWAATAPGAAAALVDGVATLDACDTGGLERVARAEQHTVEDIAFARSEFIRGMQHTSHLSRLATECVADGLRSLVGNDGFLDQVSTGVFGDDLRLAVVHAAATCAAYFPELQHLASNEI
jgi:hypothetical protein